VIVATADSNGVLLENAQAWRGFPGVNYLAWKASDCVDEPAGDTCNTTKSLKDIQRHAFSREQRLQFSGHSCQLGSALNTGAIPATPFPHKRAVHLRQDHSRSFKPRDCASLPGYQPRGTELSVGHQCARCNIADRSQILGESHLR
jgi:hypothetical protein